MAKLSQLPWFCCLLMALCFGPAFSQTEQAPTIAPAAVEMPLPEPHEFLKGVSVKDDQYARLRKDYLCRTEVVIQPNRWSRSRTPISEKYESFYINGREIDRVVELNNVPLSERSIAQQDARLKKETDTALSSEGKTAKPSAPTLEETVLATSLFVDEQRVWRDGRSFISFKFRGDRHRVPDSATEAIAKLLKGSVLIDEADRAIVEINGTTQDDVIYSNRFLMPNKFQALVYEAKRINDEIYVPSFVRIAVADDQADGVLAAELWKRSLELRTYSVSSCRKFRVTTTIVPTVTNSH
ncbi:hypothetical protein [Tunturiibacter lichenicola]|uniref:hypothetical protein n=1 Tax=Tunturiibacter lichenicola TaxID=2051959 RepID=UPI0021B35700|nr:hypothetical protein [Edaphobacter lichenicola]